MRSGARDKPMGSASQSSSSPLRGRCESPGPWVLGEETQLTPGLQSESVLRLLRVYPCFPLRKCQKGSRKLSGDFCDLFGVKEVPWEPRGIIHEPRDGMLAACQFLLVSLHAARRSRPFEWATQRTVVLSHNCHLSILVGADSKRLPPSCLRCGRGVSLLPPSGVLRDVCLNSALGQQEPFPQEKCDP